MKDDPLHQVVRGVRQRDDLRTGLGSGLVQERVTERARGGLERTFGQRFASALGDEPEAKSLAKRGHVAPHRVRAFTQRVVVMRGDHVVPGFLEGDEQSGGIGAARHRDEHPQIPHV